MSIQFTVTFEEIVCGAEGCSERFAVPAETYQRWRRTHESWYCPKGHCRSYHHESDLEKLRREKTEQAARMQRQIDYERERKESEIRTRMHITRRLNATRGVLTRTKNRVAHGVCPCCGRTFQQLARHMAGKHPDYVATAKTAGSES